MTTNRAARIPSSDRSMEPAADDRSEVFFFPKHSPPVSVRAASREEAERILGVTHQEQLEEPNPNEV